MSADYWMTQNTCTDPSCDRSCGGRRDHPNAPATTSKTYVLDINGMHDEATVTVANSGGLVVLTSNPEGFAQRLGADFERAGYVLQEQP